MPSNNGTAKTWSIAETIFTPAMVVNYPHELALEQLPDYSFISTVDNHNSKIDSSSVTLTLRTVHSSDSVSTQSMPILKRMYRCPSPSLVFDRAAIRFRPMAGSTLWLSSHVLDRSFYTSSLFAHQLAHAAATKGSALLHTALIQYRQMGILLPGISQSGKSTLALLSTLVGAKLIDDDLALVVGSDNEFVGQSFRSHVVARENTFDVLPESLRELSKPIIVEGERKYLFDREKINEKSLPRTPIHAIVFPKIMQGNVTPNHNGFFIEPLSKARSLATLIDSLNTTAIMPGLDSERRQVVATMTNMISKLPCFELSTTPMVLEHPSSTIHKILEEVSGSVRMQN